MNTALWVAVLGFLGAVITTAGLVYRAYATSRNEQRLLAEKVADAAAAAKADADAKTAQATADAKAETAKAKAEAQVELDRAEERARAEREALLTDRGQRIDELRELVEQLRAELAATRQENSEFRTEVGRLRAALTKAGITE